MNRRYKPPMDLVLYSVTTYGTEAGFQLLISFWTHRCSRTTNNSFTVINDTRMKGISIFYYSVYVFTVLHVLFLLIYLRKEKKKRKKSFIRTVRPPTLNSYWYRTVLLWHRCIQLYNFIPYICVFEEIK